MSSFIIFRESGSNKFTVVDKVNGTVEMVEEQDLASLGAAPGKANFAGLESAFVVETASDFSARHHFRP